MKVALIFEETIDAGGGFSQALNAILQFQRISNGRFEWFVFTPHRANCEILRHMGIEVQIFSPSPFDRIVSWIFSQLILKYTVV